MTVLNAGERATIDVADSILPSTFGSYYILTIFTHTGPFDSRKNEKDWTKTSSFPFPSCPYIYIYSFIMDLV